MTTTARQPACSVVRGTAGGLRATLAALLAVGLVALALIPSLATPVFAQSAAEPPVKPFLRIETGMHTAVINRLAMDANHRLLATAADDKTVRLWDLASGTLETTFRVPIADGPEGALFAVALSPDGKTVVAGGHTAATWDGKLALYLFDVDKRKMKARLGGLLAEVNHLAYSPDGRFIAAAFGGRNGLSVWDSGNGKLVAEDRDYADRSTWVAFADDGRLATVSYDGMVRLYDPGFALLAKKKAPGGGQPFSVAFSPDGQFLAIGYVDVARVDVLMAADLRPSHVADGTGLSGGNMAAVGWEPKGRAADLLAGGTARDRTGSVVLRRWSDNGKGKPRDTAIARDSINHLAALAGGGIVFATADPSWGVLDAKGGIIRLKRGVIGDFRDMAAGRFGVSPDGLRIEFGMGKSGTEPYAFDVSDGTLTRLAANAPRNAAITAPVVEAPGLKLTDWRNAARPKVNGLAVRLDPEELARSASVAPGGKHVLIGTDYTLRYIDGSGAELGKATVTGAAWGVAIAPNGRVAVAALGDGTLRWYSLERGRELEELMAFFPHTDGRRWIAWTPEGFFMHAAEGGKDLAGYHFNKGAKKMPEWVDFSQLYQLYYAPEVVVRKVAGGAAADAEVRDRLARIGAVDAYLGKRPLPAVELVEYCPLVAEAPDSRAFGRTKTPAVPAPAGGGTVASAPGVSSPGTGVPAACRPIVLASATRAFGRTKDSGVPQAPAGTATGPGAGGAAGAGGAVVEPAAFQAELPPGTTAVAFKYKVVDQGGGVGAVDVYLNGRNVGGQTTTRAFGRDRSQPAAAGAGGKPGGAPVAADGTRETQVAVSPGANLLQVKAYEAGGGAAAKSVPIELRLAAAKPADAAGSAGQTAAPVTRPTLYVLSAGVNEYKVKPLRFPRDDARTVADALAAGGKGTVFGRTEVIGLYDAQVTAAALSKAMQDVAEKARPDDTIAIYLAGHGVINELDNKYYYITADVADETWEAIAAKGFSQQMLEDSMIGINRKVKNTFLFLDTCHAGGFNLSSVDKVHDILGMYMLAGATEINRALDDYDGKNGLFAHAVLQGLERARDDEGLVTSLSLGSFVKKNVPRLAERLKSDRGLDWRQQANFRIGGTGELEGFPLGGTR